MNSSFPALNVNDAFINLKIERAYSGISYIKVSNSGSYYALLKYHTYTVYNIEGKQESEKTLRAAKSIFKKLINTYQSFECDKIYYYVNKNTGEWMWTEI
ncbi:hypothetical protein [uncultured Aquimarina sp.]|uniref:hypothetical protein n=1 Tax=uncultured Aquimarina sp. TaxID=575652 RepID=UPI002626A683|nr:hypothetical protein [uncultured Aquimarina sp.]